MESHAHLTGASGGEGAGLDSRHARATAVMAEPVADFLVRRLGEWGVHRIYGYPGEVTVSTRSNPVSRARGKGRPINHRNH